MWREKANNREKKRLETLSHFHSVDGMNEYTWPCISHTYSEHRNMRNATFEPLKISKRSAIDVDGKLDGVKWQRDSMSDRNEDMIAKKRAESQSVKVPPT